MPNVIEQAAQAIRSRLAQLEELVAEQQQLKKALGALERLLGAAHGETAEPLAKKAGPGRQAKRALASAGLRPAAGRRRRGASRAEQFAALVDEQPGITVGEAAERLKTSRNTLYTFTARLQREGGCARRGGASTRSSSRRRRSRRRAGASSSERLITR